MVSNLAAVKVRKQAVILHAAYSSALLKLFLGHSAALCLLEVALK